MTKVLFVKGNPKSTEQSYSLRLGQSFVDAYAAENPGAQVTELDLYEGNIPLIDAEVMTAWGKLAQQSELSHHEAAKVQRLGELVDQFLETDVIVFAAPMWNFGYPPMVKAYMDAIAVAGKTFQYTATGPVGLALGKKAFIAEARGGVWSTGPMTSMEHSQSHLRAFLGFLGVTDVQVLLAEGLAFDPSKGEEILAEAVARAQQAAKAQPVAASV
jgi:FMN-dependent NADH-azoreductase